MEDYADSRAFPLWDFLPRHVGNEHGLLRHLILLVVTQRASSALASSDDGLTQTEKTGHPRLLDSSNVASLRDAEAGLVAKAARVVHDGCEPSHDVWMYTFIPDTILLKFAMPGTTAVAPSSPGSVGLS